MNKIIIAVIIAIFTLLLLLAAIIIYFVVIKPETSTPNKPNNQPSSQSSQNTTNSTNHQNITNSQNTTNTANTTNSQNTQNTSNDTTQPVESPFEDYPYLSTRETETKKPLKIDFDVEYPKYDVKVMNKTDIDALYPVSAEEMHPDFKLRKLTDPTGSYFPLGDVLVKKNDDNYNVPLFRTSFNNKTYPLKSPTNIISSMNTNVFTTLMRTGINDTDYICVGNVAKPTDFNNPAVNVSDISNYKCLPKKCLIKEKVIPITARFSPIMGDLLLNPNQHTALITPAGPKTDDFYDLNKYFTNTIVSGPDAKGLPVGSTDPYITWRFKFNPECDADVIY